VGFVALVESGGEVWDALEEIYRLVKFAGDKVKEFENLKIVERVKFLEEEKTKLALMVQELRQRVEKLEQASKV